MSDQDPSAALATPDMQVIDADGALVGRVKEVHERRVLVDRRLKRDLYVPIAAIVGREGDTLSLNATNDQFDDLGWGHPALLGGPDDDPLTATDHDVVERDLAAAGNDPERAAPLDSRPGQVTTSGTNDGEQLPPEDFLSDEQQRLRDCSG